jgi:hypothetical protein
MIVALYTSVHPCGGIEINCSLKRDKDDWWEECGIPDDVVKYLSDMLVNFGSKAKGFEPSKDMTEKELSETTRKAICERAKQILQADKCSVRYAVFAAEQEAKSNDGEKSFDELIHDIRYGTGDSWLNMRRA